MRIFVVEDDQLFQEVIKVSLQSKGYKRINIFSSAEECMKNLSLKPGIVLLDIGLTRLNGIDLLKKIKQARKGIRAIMLSGTNDPHTIKECMNMGADGYVVKGQAALGQIAELVGKLVRRRNVQRAFSVMAAAAFVLVSLLCAGLFLDVL